MRGQVTSAPWHGRILDGVLALVWAPRCAACDSLLAYPTRGVVCDDCWRHVPKLTPPLCRRCGAPLATRSPENASCTSGHPESGLTRRRAAGVYEGTLRAIIHAFKYQHRHSLSRPLAALMRSAGDELLSDADYVVPVPLHPARRWSRGFNQAGALARHLGVPVHYSLRRTRPTPPQTTLTAAQRWINVHAAFALKHWVGRGPFEPNLKGCVVVLVDDVATTGATLEACAQVLLSAGAREVRALTAAAASPAARRRPRQRRPEDARRPLVASLGRPPGARSSLGPRPGARDLVRSDRDP